MEAGQQVAVEQMIAAALGKTPMAPVPAHPGPLSFGPGVGAQTEPQPAQAPVVTEPTYPSQVPLDEYEVLMVKALGWRIQSSEKTSVILKTENNNINEMRNDLLRRCVKRLGIDVHKYNIQIDSTTKMINIQKRG